MKVFREEFDNRYDIDDWKRSILNSNDYSYDYIEIERKVIIFEDKYDYSEYEEEKFIAELTLYGDKQ